MFSSLQIVLILVTVASAGPIVSVYWEGYPEHHVEPYVLSNIPLNASYVIIAFAAPSKINNYTNTSTQLSFGISLISYSYLRLKYDIQLLKNRPYPPKILLSLMDTPTTHWNVVDPYLFSLNLQAVLEDLDIDGIDIDSESGMPPNSYVNTFIGLITNLRQVMPDKIITYTTYGGGPADKAILSAMNSSIDFVQTISYGLELPYMINEYHFYTNLTSPSKVSIGVGVNITGLNLVTTIGNWLRNNNINPSMTLWSATQDVLKLTGYPDNIWFDTMYDSLG